MTMIQNKTTEWNEDEYNYVLDLEKRWQKSLSRYSESELLKIFPEAKKVIPEKINDWQEIRDTLTEIIKSKLTSIKNSGTDWGTKLFWREWIKMNDGERLLEMDSHITRLRNLQWLTKGKSPPGKITRSDIDKVKSIPIENILNISLRKSGGVLIGLCPLHKEKHPSFYIYPETNTCWCYGCNQGGDTINIIKLLHGLNFIQAVQWLNK